MAIVVSTGISSFKKYSKFVTKKNTLYVTDSHTKFAN